MILVLHNIRHTIKQKDITSVCVLLNCFVIQSTAGLELNVAPLLWKMLLNSILHRHKDEGTPSKVRSVSFKALVLFFNSIVLELRLQESFKL